MKRADLFATPAPPEKRTAKRDRAMASAEQHAPEGWLSRAYAIVRVVAADRETFTTDDVWGHGLDRPPNPRALGPVMMALAREGVIEATPNFRPTTQASRNCAPVRIWRSLIRRSS